jgi:hydroxymethylpyrimidine/phosphomethylpyrimidine kinase
MPDAARELAKRLGTAVLLKGGRLAGEALDVLCPGRDREVVELRSERVAGGNEHGAGCTLSAALCARLALGDELVPAVRAAKRYVTQALRNAYRVGQGRGTLGLPD